MFSVEFIKVKPIVSDLEFEPNGVSTTDYSAWCLPGREAESTGWSLQGVFVALGMGSV